MAMTVHVDIVSAEGAIHSGLAEMVFAPGKMGELGIAPRHSPLITQLKPGDVRVQAKQGEMMHFYVSGGMLEVQPDVVTVLADTAIRAETSMKRRHWKPSVAPRMRWPVRPPSSNMPKHKPNWRRRSHS